MNLDKLDSALQELGMLSSVTDARRDYLREPKADYCMMRLQPTRYVSNVTVGYCMKRAVTRHRLCPYAIPLRHRTKSENSDATTEGPDKCEAKNHSQGDPILFSKLSGDLPKRCLSLENLTMPECEPSNETNELDCVSTQIQKLQVDE